MALQYGRKGVCSASSGKRDPGHRPMKIADLLSVTFASLPFTSDMALHYFGSDRDTSGPAVYIAEPTLNTKNSNWNLSCVKAIARVS